MSGESDKIERDPKKKSFWNLKNIAALVMVAILPAAGGWAWNGITKGYETISNLEERIKHLENDRANNKAIWDAITAARNEIVEIKIETEVNRRLLELGIVPKTQPAPKTAPELPPSPNPVPPVLRPEQKPFTSEEYRSLHEQKFPNDPVKKK